MRTSQQRVGAPALEVSVVASYEEYLAHAAEFADTYRERWLTERELAASQEDLSLAGYCHVCDRATEFSVGYGFSHDASGEIVLPNWREELICRHCHLKNRLRATIHLLEEHCRLSEVGTIYVPEHSGPFYDRLVARYPNVVGSEYFGQEICFGATNSFGIRNEDLTRLTFDDGRFDHIVALEILEHIPDYTRALRECLRCLAPAGLLLLTVPFHNGAETLTRAQVTPSGRVEHLLEPEYHPDPRTAEGVLCYYHFGWDLLDQLRQVGFAESAALLYWSRHYGYLGVEQLQILARKHG